MPSRISLFLIHSSSDKAKLCELADSLRKREISLWLGDQISTARAITEWMSQDLATGERFLLDSSDSVNGSPHVWKRTRRVVHADT
jgi:hypothetical protein